MSRNIKEIGKELMGKSLNSFHRKTGLTQLEENNKMQDGILDGILSQVDDAYIEKTEQSNVIHLDGSGDGVVVVDSIEGNTERLLYTPSEPIKNGLVSLIDVRKMDVDNHIIKDEISDNELALHYFTQVKIQDNGLLVEGAENTNHNTASLGYKNTFPKIRSLVITLNKLRDMSPSYLFDLRTGSETYIYSNGVKGVSKLCVDGVEKSIYLNQIPNNKKSVVYVELSSDLENITPSILSRYTKNEGMNAILYSVLIYDRVLTSEELQQIQDYEMSKSFELKSSFEEKVNDEGKYEIEILSNNKNLFDVPNIIKEQMTFTGVSNSKLIAFAKVRKNATYKVSGLYTKSISQLGHGGIYIGLFNNKPNSTDTWYNTQNSTYVYRSESERVPLNTTIQTGSHNYIGIYVGIATGSNYNHIATVTDLQLEESSTSTEYIPHKHNKIKLLLDEPLYKGNKVCMKNGCLGYWKYMNKIVLDGSENWNTAWSGFDNDIIKTFHLEIEDKAQSGNSFCDKFRLATIVGSPTTEFYTTMDGGRKEFAIGIMRTKLTTQNVEGFKTWLSNNPVTVVYELAEPLFIPLTNEYGEPILLEGYENGTIYIDSTIVPTTTVRYTPKMESFKTLKEVNNNNIMLTNDVNDNIIPYMMDVDLMIMEKEMALMSHQYKLRRTGEKDMTSMQKRTQDMLTRLIKGKTLTEQECKTRVVTYLDAGKITDAQADELMLLISEVYA